MRCRPKTSQRRRLAAAMTAAVAAFGALSYGVGTADGALESSSPSLEFANPNSQALFGTAYEAALKNLLQINTISYDPAVYNKSGLMDPDVGIVRAGGGYPQPWTRDASVNSWNATSLLSPALARNTLWAAVDKDSAGRLQIQQDDQQWDQVIWARTRCITPPTSTRRTWR